MNKPIRHTTAFKSGNSVAIRLPKTFGVEAGTELTIREEDGKVIIERADTPPKRIDLTGVYGSIPGLKPLTREEREFDDSPRDWHLLDKLK